MKRTTFDENRDMRIADEASVPQASLCTAHGCPNLWSTSIGHLCRWHASAEPENWPAVTRDMQEAVTDRARRGGDDRAPARPMSMADKFALLQRLRTIFSEPRNPREWAHRLKAREDAGERLNDRQKTAWRAALAATTSPEDA